jgi:hypothetical protein
VKISTDLGLPEREIYEGELKKVNKMKEVQHQVYELDLFLEIIRNLKIISSASKKCKDK